MSKDSSLLVVLVVLLLTLGLTFASCYYVAAQEERLNADCVARGGHVEVTHGTLNGRYVQLSTCEGATR